MRNSIIACTLIALSGSTALAHEGPRIWLGNVNGVVTTFHSDDDFGPSEYWPCRLFTTDMEPFFGIYTTEFPGYEVRQDGGDVTPNTTFGFNITGPALYFDEAEQAFVTTTIEFGPPEPGPIPQIAMSLNSAIRQTGAGPVTGFNFFTFFSIGDHAHLAYTLLGDGTSASNGPSGVYAISMEITSPTLMTSEPFYLLLGKDVEQDDPLLELAREVARETLIGNGVPGDMDCDGAVTPADTAEFVQAVLTANNGATAPACCSLRTADMNQDSRLDAVDIELFTADCLGM